MRYLIVGIVAAGVIAVLWFAWGGVRMRNDD